MEFGMLGPLEVREGPGEVPLRGAKQQKLVARLLVDRNRVVSLDSLVETLWPDGLPSDPAHQVQVYVSQIRKALGPDAAALETASPGYRLRTNTEDVDLDRFEILCADARSAVAQGDFARAVELCDRALGLWRGPFMHGFEGEDFAYPDSVRAEALRSQVEIDRLTALVGNGEARALLPELEARVAEDPSDERYVALLMHALHQEGRQKDAIDAFHRVRTTLAEELGIDPSPELQDLFTKMLRGDPPPRPESTNSDVDADEGGGAKGLVSRASRSQVVVIGVILALLVSVSVVAVLTRGPFQNELGSLQPNSLGAIDPGSGRIVANLTLPVRPTRVAVGFGALWITSASSGQLLRVDPETLAIRQEIDLGSGIGPISFGDSAVWVANIDEGTVTRIDPETNDPVQTVSVGNGPSDMEAAGEHLWIANRLDASVAKFDPRRGEVVSRIPIGLSPGGLVATDDSLWVTDEASATVVQVDLASESAVSTVHVGNGPGPLTADGDDVWVVNRSDDTVSRIGGNGSVEATLNLEHDLTSIEEVDGIPWVAHQGGVERVDPHLLIAGEPVASGAASTDLAFGAGRVWVVTEPSLAEHSGGTLRMLSDSVDSLDPANSYSPETWRVLDLLNDGLLAYGGPDSRSLLANLAVRVPTPSDKGKTYTFQLRDNVRYSNGEEIHPDDVRHSFERLLGNGHPVAGLFSSIVGSGSCLDNDDCDLSDGIVSSAASRTVTFHLAFPDPDFLSKLATPPASILPSSVPKGIQEMVPSTGPYEVVTYEPTRELVLEQRDDFEPWDSAAQAAGYVDRIVLELNHVGKESQAVLAGDADWTAFFGEDISELRRRHGSQIREYPFMAIWAAFLNTKAPPFDDVDVRRAVNMAVDREAVLQTFGGPEQASITCQILPPGTQGYESFCPYTQAPTSGAWIGPDLQRARRLVRGKERVPVTVYGFDQVADTAELLAAVLRDLGYPAESRRLSTEDFFEMVSTQPRIQAGVFAWFADTPGPLGFIAPVFACTHHQGSNYAHHCDPVVDRLSNRAARLQFSDPQLANELWVRVDRRLTRAAAWVPLVNPKGVELVSERVGNYSYSPVTGIILSQVWVN